MICLLQMCQVTDLVGCKGTCKGGAVGILSRSLYQ